MVKFSKYELVEVAYDIDIDDFMENHFEFANESKEGYLNIWINGEEKDSCFDRIAFCVPCCKEVYDNIYTTKEEARHFITKAFEEDTVIWEWS